jgi:hypothetical protein
MDDGKYIGRTERSLGLALVLTMIMISHISISKSFNIEIENMRHEGLERFDVSIFAEERVAYIHSKISLAQLLSSIEYGQKVKNEFNRRANTTFGKILDSKIKGMAMKVTSKLRSMYEKTPQPFRTKRAIEFIGNIMSKIFGTVGPDQWKQNNRNIIALKDAIARQITNSELLHNDIDQNRHLINTQNEYLKYVSREVINNSNRLDRVDN